MVVKIMEIEEENLVPEVKKTEEETEENLREIEYLLQCASVECGW
jgi:hypothetical protein